MSIYAKSVHDQKFLIQNVHIFRQVFVIKATAKPRSPPQMSLVSWHSFSCSLLSGLYKSHCKKETFQQ